MKPDVKSMPEKSFIASTWSVKEAFKIYTSHPDKGLSDEEAKKRLQNLGPNEITDNQVSWWNILIRQFTSPFIYILIVAGILALMLGELMDASMIFFFMLVNGILGFYQEYHTEKVVRLLKKYISCQATVIREGKKQKVGHRDLVVGDLVLVKAGDLVPADMRFLRTINLQVDESVLTGESAPVDKTAEKLKNKVTQIYEAKNLGFFGTTIVSGEGMGIVVATGMHTVIGGISQLTSQTIRISSFEKGILKFSRFTLLVILATLSFVLMANLALKGREVNIGNLSLFIIALAVGVIPEGLPAVITFALSQGALKLSKNKVVVKRLSAIEDLGSIEVLCCDKTGTLTENILEVDRIEAEDENKTLLYCGIAGAILTQETEPTEAFDLAIWKKMTVVQKQRIRQYELINEIPFDPVRRLSSVLVQRGKMREIVLRGAPEKVLQTCVNLTDDEKKRLDELVIKFGRSGRRVLAVATKKYAQTDYTQKDENTGFSWCGLITFVDPIKKTAKDAIIKAQQMGIKIKILTGDSQEVAGAVAYEVGLVQNPKVVVLGDDFDKLNLVDKQKLVEDACVFARVSPKQKYEIIQLLEKNYEVGFVGEGINDAPALKIANVALVVSSASDIAREAADIVLLKKSLRVIIDGIEEGRLVFANTMKYIKATLTSNFGNFYAVAIVSLFIDYLPMLPSQILLLNLLTDLPLLVVATDTVDISELKTPKTYHLKDFGILSTVLGLISSVFDFVVFRLFVPLGAAFLQTNWFLASVVTELALIFSIRTRGWFFKAKMPSTALLLLTATAMIISLAIPFTKSGRNFFGFVEPSASHLAQISFIGVVYFLISEVVKLIYHKIFYSKTQQNFK